MRLSDILLAISVAAVWGFNFVVIRMGIDAFPPLLFSALRFTFAALPLVFFLPKPNVSWGIIFGIGLILGVIKFALLFIGMDVGLSAGLASLVLQSQAFFTVILASIFLAERPSPLQVTGILVAFVGISLVATTVDTNVTPLGLSLVLAAALAWAFSNLLMKKAGSVDMLSLIVWVSLIPPLPLIVLSLIFEGWNADIAALTHLTWKGGGSVIYIALLSTIFGFAVWGRLISIYGASRVAPFSLLVPIFGMGSSAIILGEEFSSIRLFAAFLVIIGLILTVIKPSWGRLVSVKNTP